MIDWDETYKQYKINEKTAKTRNKIIAKCDKCGVTASRILSSVKRGMKNNNGIYLCHQCSTNSKQFLEGCSERAKKKWQDPQYIKNNLEAVQSEAYKNKKREKSLELWQDPDYMKHMMSPEMKQLRAKNSSVANKAKWKDPEYREKLIKILRERMIRRWRDEDYREHMRKVSSKHFKNLWKNGTFEGVFDEAFCEKMKIVNAEILSRPEVLKKLSDAGKKNWEDPGYREAVISGNIKKWSDPEYHKKMSAMNAESLSKPEILKKLSDAGKRNWQNPEYREAVISGNIKKWDDPEYREKMAIIRTNCPKISNLQHMLYNFLDDLGIEYYQEGEKTRIGYYIFDCLIPHNNSNILVECQGDYWHSLENIITRDKGKFTYINRYFPEYEIIYLWEHEFYAKDRVLDRLKLKLGIDIETIDFNFKDIIISDNIPSKDIKCFLDSYHYIGRGRGGRTFGAYYNNTLVAVVVFSSPLRQNQKHLFGDFTELSRFCIHPSYHKKNFASWFLSRCIKTFNNTIVAYADSTVGHTGIIYKALGFELHHEVKPDYWYVDNNGYVMHKKTLYSRAVKMKLTETEFAEEFGYFKKFGGPKFCFIKS